MGRLAVGLLVLALGACSRDDPAPTAAQPTPPPKPETTAADCVLDDRSGRPKPIALGDLSDPVAAKILSGAAGARGGCPASLDEIHAKLAVTDADACARDMFSEVQTVLVSERSQLRRTATGTTQGCTADPIAGFRGVTTRACSGRPAHALLMAVFGLTVGSESLPTDAELIGLDAERGIFNYYSLEDGGWVFHGSSIDMLAGPTAEGLRRCAACHPGGGLVLKEMRSPWVFWEGRDTLPGVAEILSAHPALGSRAKGKVLDLRPAGKELEETIEAGNRVWTKTRVDHALAEGTLRDLLQPLFCAAEIELGAASQTVTPPHAAKGEDGNLALVADELLVDPRFEIDTRLVVPVTEYHAAIEAAGQKVVRACGATLEDAEGRPLRDTVFDLVHPWRASAELHYVDVLVERGVLDEALARAVLSVDFTRPVFSPTRCALLNAVPETNGLATRDAIEAALREAMSRADAAGTPGAAELLAALDDGAAALEQVAGFVRACTKRDTAGLIRDVVRDVSRRRRRARKLPLIELPEMLPVDDFPENEDGRLDPTTCRFVPDPA